MKKGLLKVLCLVVTLCMLIGCTVIANAVTMPKIFKVCSDSGYQCPIICTPEQLGKEEDDE